MGFLPFKATKGDKVFMSIAFGILIHLLWIVIFSPETPLYLATVMSFVLAFAIFKWG